MSTHPQPCGTKTCSEQQGGLFHPETLASPPGMTPRSYQTSSGAERSAVALQQVVSPAVQLGAQPHHAPAEVEHYVENSQIALEC